MYKRSLLYILPVLIIILIIVIFLNQKINIHYYSKPSLALHKNIVLKIDNKLADRQAGKIKSFPAQKPIVFKEKEGDKDGFEENENDGPEQAQEQEFMRTRNPLLGRPTRENLLVILNQMMHTNNIINSPGSNSSPWVERGPDNVGGRTRAIMVDPRDNTKKTIWAAGVDGGLWKTTDITATSPNWTNINEFFDNLAITCLAYDPVNVDTMYFGTGEGWYNIDAVQGFGIWRTTDGGANWAQLSSTTGSSFWYINKIAIHPSNHNVYIATRNGIYMSNDAGVTFTNIGYSGKAVSDIEISSSGRIHIGIGDYNTVREYHYTDNNGVTWDPVANNFTTTVATGNRVELAIAPSNNAVLYALVGTTGALQGVYKSTNSGVNWSAITTPTWYDQSCTTSSNDPTRGQSWYDLALAVNPSDQNNVIMGGVDLFKSTDGGSTWTQISNWWGGCSYQYVHADQHIILFENGSNTVAYFGNDGGIYRTTNATSSVPTITDKNTNYNVTQFYSCAIHPNTGSNIYLAGAQDNGTQRFSTSGVSATTQVYSGDGGFCFIDQSNPTYQIAAYSYNNFYRSSNSGVSFPTTLINDNSTGKFINPAAYDYNLHILYTGKSTSSIYRVSSVTGTPSSAITVTITGMTDMASHIRVSPYTTSSSTLFIGTAGGKLYKVTNADNTPTVTNITGSSFPAGSISCVEIGSSENELLVTFFNYGVISIWYTSNGGSTWVNKEGNLPDMPVRWALFNPYNRDEVLLATELGVWATTNLSSSPPTWAPSNYGLANVRVDMLQYRSSDKMVFAATHGRGLYSNIGFSQAPLPAFGADNTQPCINQTVNFKDSSTMNPTSWTWTITPSGYNFTGGTTANSQNPKIQFTSAGTSYTVTLNAGNSNGNNNLVKANYIITRSQPVPSFTVNNSSQCLSGNNFVFTNTSSGASTYLWKFGDNLTSTTVSPVHSYTNAGTYTVKLISTSAHGCVDSMTSTVYTRPKPLSSFIINNVSQCLTGNSFIFTNTSTGAATYQWKFGDNTTSASTSPTHIYTTSGAFTIKLISISSYGCKDSTMLTVNVRPQPKASFTVNNSGQCLNGNNFVFTNTATGALTYLWKFGDNKTSTSTSPGHSYASTGTYTVKLVATSGYGCKDSTTMAITVASPPVASFTVNNATQCLGGNVFNFTNKSTGASTYLWKFGDNLTSTTISPSHTYSTSGTFTVKLISTIATGCSDSTTSTVTIRPKSSPSFTVNNSSQCLNGNSFKFTNTSAGASTYLWKFGDNSTSTTISPTHSYTATGTYTVKLVSTTINGCSDSSTATVYVRPKPFSSFTVNNASQCLSGNSFVFTNSSIGASTNLWKFGDNLTSTAISPSHSYTASGTFTVKLVSTTLYGCKDSTTSTVYARPQPVTKFTVNNSSQCLKGNIFRFTNTTTGATTYTWKFGDNNTSTTTSPTHTYTTAGIYAVKLISKSSYGCKDSMTSNLTVKANPKVNLGTDVTAPDNSHVTLNASTGFDAYLWSNGKKTSSITIDTTTIDHKKTLFWVKVTKTGCDGYDSVYVTFIRFTFINHPQDNFDLIVYPNPAATILNVSISNINQEIVLILADLNGKIIKSFKIRPENGKLTTQLDISNLAKGFYYLNIKRNEEMKVIKFEKN